MDYIDGLPLNDSPEVFGLHDNAEISYQKQESENMIGTVLSIQSRMATAAGGMTTDDIVLLKSKTLLEALPEQLLLSDGKKE